MSAPVRPATPELDKRSKIIEGDGHRAVVAFLEWVDSEASGGLGLVRYRQGVPHEIYSTSFESILASFYGLDLDKIEREKLALLEYMRELNAQ
jgi:hypothetical protein